MKVRENSSDFSKANDFNETLLVLIASKHIDLFRVANSELNILFWQVGRELNRLAIDKKLIQSVPSNFSKLYGPFFSRENLKKMRLIASQFPDKESISAVAPFVSWQHLLAISKFESLETRIFYIKLTIEKGLSVKSLNRLTRTTTNENFHGRIERKNLLAKRNIRLFQEIFKLGLVNIRNQEPIIANIFDKPYIQLFRLAFESSKTNPLSKIPSENFVGENRLLELIKKHVQEQQQWFNGFLNMTFWEIGNYINREVVLQKEKSPESIINSVVLHLKKKQYKGFSKKRLKEMSDFAGQFNNLAAVKVANLLSWQHIIILLQLKEIRAKLYYTKLVVLNDLSAEALRKEITKGSHEKMRIENIDEENMFDELIKSKREISKKIKNGRETIFETVRINFNGLRNGNINIFESPYLQLLNNVRIHND